MAFNIKQIVKKIVFVFVFLHNYIYTTESQVNKIMNDKKRKLASCLKKSKIFGIRD